MSKDQINQFDATAGNNTDIEGINTSETMVPSAVNNSIRSLMSLLKKQDVGTHAMTSPDINGGTIDGTVIGGSSSAAGNFSEVVVSGTGNKVIQVTSTDALATMEIGGTTGAFIDIKTPTSDDYDLRLGGGATGGSIQIAGGTFTISGSAETMATFVDDGAVTLYFNNSAVLATASGGISVTGDATVSGLTTSGTMKATSRLFVGDIATALPVSQGMYTWTQSHDASNRGGVTWYSTHNSAGATEAVFAKGRSGAIGSFTTVQDGDTLGSITWCAADGTDMNSVAARISAQINGTPGSDDTPGRLTFHTTGDGTNNPSERVRVLSDGKVAINKTSSTEFLEVHGAIGSSHSAANFGAGDARANLDFATGAGGTRVGSVNGNYGTVFLANSGEKMRINGSGAVGINRSDPQNLVGDTAGGLVIQDGGRAATTTQVGVYNSSGVASFTLLQNGTGYFKGPVGIGAAAPARLAHISAAAADTSVLRIESTGSHVAGVELLSGHGNWGVYNSDTVADALEFRDDSAAATRMIINSVGDVGVGTTAPSAFGGTTMQVHHASTYSALLVSSNDHVLQMIASDTHGAQGVGTRSNHDLNILANDAIKATVKTTGEFSVNTTSATGMINVTASSWSKNCLYLNSSTSGSADFCGIGMTTAGTESANIFTDESHNFYITKTGGFNVRSGSSGISGGTTDLQVDVNGNVALSIHGGPLATFAADKSNGSGFSMCTPDGDALQIYQLKNTDVESHIGFKSGDDTNWYFNTSGGLGGIGATSQGVYMANHGTSWTSNSDERKKKNLEPIENALDKIANCRAMTGHFIDIDEDDAKRRPFLIAQDWATALPEAVDFNTVDDDGNENLGLSYEGTIPLLVAAIKELRTQNLALTERISTLEGD